MRCLGVVHARQQIVGVECDIAVGVRLLHHIAVCIIFVYCSIAVFISDGSCPACGAIGALRLRAQKRIFKDFNQFTDNS